MATKQTSTAPPMIPLIGVVNTTEEVVGLLCAFLQMEGFATAATYTRDIKYGRLDFGAWLDQYEPAVVLWDIAIPYEENWAYFQRTRAQHGHRVPFILTTTNKRSLEQLVGDTSAIEIVGKPFDLELLLEAVRRALPPSSAPT